MFRFVNAYSRLANIHPSKRETNNWSWWTVVFLPLNPGAYRFLWTHRCVKIENLISQQCLFAQAFSPFNCNRKKNILSIRKIFVITTSNTMTFWKNRVLLYVGKITSGEGAEAYTVHIFIVCIPRITKRKTRVMKIHVVMKAINCSAG